MSAKTKQFAFQLNGEQTELCVQEYENLTVLICSKLDKFSHVVMVEKRTADDAARGGAFLSESSVPNSLRLGVRHLLGVDDETIDLAARKFASALNISEGKPVMVLFGWPRVHHASEEQAQAALFSWMRAVEQRLLQCAQ